MKETIGFIGLGRMGQAISLNLLKAGYALKVYNRTASKTEPLVTQGAEAVSRPADTLSTGGIVVSMLWDDAAVEEVVMSPGFLEQLGKGGIHLSMGTVSPVISRRLAELHAQHGSYYLDAPVFGVPQAAAAQKLWICLSGSAAAKERVRPLLEATSQGIFDFGEEVGAGNIVKLGGNFISMAAAQAMAEVLSAAKKNGLDPLEVVSMLTQTIFPIAVYQHFGKQIAFDPEHFAPGRLALKDVGIFEDTAMQVASQAPLAHLLHRLLAEK